MTQIRLSLDADTFDAVIFDLDGVVTKTARVHAASWKRLFDDYSEAARREPGRALRALRRGR